MSEYESMDVIKLNISVELERGAIRDKLWYIVTDNKYNYSGKDETLLLAVEQWTMAIGDKILDTVHFGPNPYQLSYP